jgi:twitching motility protein PilT
MRDGDTEGMQHFDGEIEKMIRSGTVSLETGLAFSSNAGNLRLELADFTEASVRAKKSETPAENIEMEIER